MAVAAVVGVVAALGASAAGAIAVTAIAIGIGAASLVMGIQAARMYGDAPAPKQAERKQLVRSGTAPKQVILGKTLVSGVWLFAEEDKTDAENGDGTYKEWLYSAVGIAGHKCKGINQTYFNETPISDFDEYANHAVFNDPVETDGYLLQHAPNWKADMIGRGTLWARVSMLFNNDKYPSGIPTPRFEVEGSNEVYDPRSDSYGYTDNLALCILYVLQKWMNVRDDQIIWSGWGGFVEAANLCDELVINPDGTSEKRYTLNGSFLLNERRGEVLGDMLRCCGGEFVRVGGRIGLLPAAYYGPATFTIHESDIVGDIDIQPEPERAKSTNVVSGSFIDPGQNYIETDFPVVKDDEAIARDGEEIPIDLNLRFVTSPYQAQRLANIELNRAQAGAVVKFNMNLKGFYCRRGRVVNLDVPSLGLSGEYRVIGMEGHISDGVTITLIQEHIDIYDDAVGVGFESPPLTNLPTGGVAAPTNLQFLAESLGDVVQGKLVWQTRAPATAFNEILIHSIDSEGKETLVLTGQAVGNNYSLNGLPVAHYKASVRSVTSEGRHSNFETIFFAVDTPSIPEAVDISRSNWAVELRPQFGTPVPIGTLFEFWYLADNASFISDPPTYGEEYLAQAKLIHTGSSLNHSTLSPDRWQHYWIRTVNLYGKSDFLYVKTGTTRETDLVTSVFERLVAIEIQSQNWNDSAGTGFKIFSPASEPYRMPDGTWLQNPDGLVVMNHALIKGNSSFQGKLSIEDRSGNVGMKITNQRIDVYDAAGGLRVRIGKLS